jgi:hypothetical protein
MPSPTPTPGKYYLHTGETTTGPFTVEELLVFQSSGAIDGDTQIHDGTQWQPARKFISKLPHSGDPDRTLQAARLLEEDAGEPVMTAARWESLLFILSFPVLIPSLILAFVMAKRWGHIDVYLILVDGLLLTGLAFLTSPLLGVVILISWLASVFLYWLRRDRQRAGIFLGYSNLIAYLLIFGGGLAIGGFIAVFPFSQFGRWQTIRRNPIETTFAAARDRGMPSERTVVFTDGALDFSHSAYRQKKDGTWRFIAKAKADTVRFSRPQIRQLWNNYKELAGREVELVDTPVANFGGRRDRVEIGEGDAKRLLDTPGLTFSLVEGSEGRLWIASTRPLAGTSATVQGVARIIYNDSSVGRDYAQAKRGNMPYMGLAIFEGEKGLPGPAPEAQEVWVPLKDSRGAFWFRFPEGVVPEGSESARGINLGTAAQFEGLTGLNAELFSVDAGRVLYHQSPAAYLAEEKVGEKFRSEVAWNKFPWLAAGLGLLGLAIWRPATNSPRDRAVTFGPTGVRSFPAATLP